MKPKIAAEERGGQEETSTPGSALEPVVENSVMNHSAGPQTTSPIDTNPIDVAGDHTDHMSLDVEIVSEHVDLIDTDHMSAEAGIDKQAIPDIVIGRLPVYLRTLKLLATEGQEVASSQELGERLGISSAQIRKDLSHFGEFGKQGTGYNIAYLCRQLEKILKVDCIWPVVLVGAGYLGHALASYNGFVNRGFRIVAVFDNDETKIGTRMGAVADIEPIRNIPQAVSQYQCQIAIIAVPAEAAQEVADQLIEAGIKSILCYAPITLNVPKHIRVEYIDPVIHFQHMTFYLEKNCLDE